MNVAHVSAISVAADCLSDLFHRSCEKLDGPRGRNGLPVPKAFHLQRELPDRFRDRAELLCMHVREAIDRLSQLVSIGG